MGPARPPALSSLAVTYFVCEDAGVFSACSWRAGGCSSSEWARPQVPGRHVASLISSCH